MPRSREATSTIKGYYYQFDYYILQLLDLCSDDDSVCVEGIEDVDVIIDDTVEAVQCKYYEETKCSPSRVGEAIRPMLRHFVEHKEGKFRYKLYGHFKSGQDSIPDDFGVDYAKDKFFTYTSNGEYHELHKELSLGDSDISEFLERLELQLDASSYEEQYKEIISKIQNVLCCTEYDACYFYYNNAVAFVKRVAVKKSILARTITRKQFLSEIETKKVLFDRWYIEIIGFEKYYKAARRQFFSSTNVSPTNRFFLVESDERVTDAEIAELIMEISRKWRKLSKREPNPFCPYIYIHGLSESRLMNVKKVLVENDFYFWDGYDYKGATFNPVSLTKPINGFLGIKAKIINKKNEVDVVINSCNTEKAIYQFFLKKPFYNMGEQIGKEFQIQETVDVAKII